MKLCAVCLRNSFVSRTNYVLRPNILCAWKAADPATARPRNPGACCAGRALRRSWPQRPRSACGHLGAATWGGAKVEIDLEVTLGLCDQMTVSQRLRPLVFGGPNYAEQRKAIVAAGERMPGQDRRSGPQPRKAERQVSLEALYPT